MRFVDRLKNALARWLYGRNGVDQLNVALIWAMAALSVAGLFFRGGAASTILGALGTALALWAVFRMLSRDLPRRRAENAWFVQKVLRLVQGRLRRLRDREHKYFTCPACRTVCRVPRGKGRIVVTCPRCRAQIRGKS